MVVVVASFGSVATVFNAGPFFRGGLQAMGWTYMASAACLLAGALIIVARPRTWVTVTFLLLVDVLVVPAATQVLSGGLTSGLYALPWTLLAPLGAALALGLRSAIAHLALFGATVGAVALLEPTAVRHAPTIDTAVLLSYNVPSLLSLGLIAAGTSLYLLRQVERFRAQADGLLLNILPEAIATRLKAGEKPIADRYEAVTVLFADIVGFTRLSSGAEPGETVQVLNELFSTFDELAVRHGVLKIKTIGDAYMAAGGLPDSRPDHTAAVVELARDMLTAVEAGPRLRDESIHIRIGIDTGRVVAGVIGRDRFIYDLWSDTVNVASRLESNGLPDRIVVSERVMEQLVGRYRFERRDPVDMKGKGLTVSYALVDDRSERPPSR